MLSFDIASLDIVSLDIESFDMLSFFIESLDIESFDIVSFFMTSSAKAAGASASPNDNVAADRMRVVDHDVAISTESIFRPGNGCCLQNFERSRCLLRTPEKELITRM